MLCCPCPRLDGGQIREAVTCLSAITGIRFRRYGLGRGQVPKRFQGRSGMSAGRLRSAAPRATLPSPATLHPLKQGWHGQTVWPTDSGRGRAGGDRCRGGEERPEMLGDDALVRGVRGVRKGGRPRPVPFTPRCLLSLVLFTLPCNSHYHKINTRSRRSRCRGNETEPGHLEGRGFLPPPRGPQAVPALAQV